MKRLTKVAILLCIYNFVVLGGSYHQDEVVVVEDLKTGGVLENNVVTSSTSFMAKRNQPLMVDLTLIAGADSRGAVCLDGTLPGYHLDRGFGSGENGWLIHLQGGGWCSTIANCVNRATTRFGSSDFMEKQLPFTASLSNRPEENPDFYNWNRVVLRYCDGASFTGNGTDEAVKLFFRGQLIWSVSMEALMAEGMEVATETLLSGSSAGGLASIIHCDEFRELFPESTKVKCFSDAGMFLDAMDVSGGYTLRNTYADVVSLQEVKENLPSTCTRHMDVTSCFFPHNLINNIKTPMFLLNTAYDSWQIKHSLSPPSADPYGYWDECRHDLAKCNSSQMQFLQDFRRQMLDALRVFMTSKQNGVFINSCFLHGQCLRQDAWFAADSPLLQNKSIAQSVGDWYFDRAEVKAIDCEYPCDNTCPNIPFK